MKRRLLSPLISLLLLSGCAANPTYLPFNQGYPAQGQGFPAQNVPQSLRFFGQSAASADWYSHLSPELQRYYAPAQGKTGRDLFLALNQIITQGQHVSSYQDAKSYLYAAGDNITVQQRSGLIGAYSNIFVPGKGGNGNSYREQGDQNQDGFSSDFINAEHTWPQSFFNKELPMVADMHHIFPTLSKPNAMRSNYPLGMATGVVVYQDSAHAKLGVVDVTGTHSPADIQRWFNLPWNQQPHDIISHDLKATFEPPDVQKGNSARAMLYFYLRYYHDNIRNGGYTEEDFWDSKVPTFIQWTQVDPVNAQDQHRNDLIYQRQGNRNPFVDIPNLAELIGPEVFIQGP